VPVLARVCPVFQAYPDFAVAQVHGKCLEVVAPRHETTAACEIETASMPVARDDAAAHRSAAQRISHVWALIVGGVNAPLDIEQGDAAFFIQLDRPGAARRDVR